MREWFAEVLYGMQLDSQTEGYLLGRGAKPQSILDMSLTCWDLPASGCCEDPAWRRFGREGRGEMLEGMLTVPLYSARGELLGADFRQVFGAKQILRYLLPELRTPEGKTWVPVFVGMRAEVARALWEGADLWFVEGLFDLFALQWVLPEGHQVLGCGRAALNASQVAFLRRLRRPRGPWVNIVLDMDKAGRRGSLGWKDDAGVRHRGIVEQLHDVGLTAWDIPYLSKDPGDVWDQGGSVALRKMFGAMSKERPGGY